jgi:hypothetical protein
MVERAIAIVRDHGELAYQRRGELQRQRHNQVDPLRLTMCRGCDDSRFGATTVGESSRTVACDVLLGTSRIESDARGWGEYVRASYSDLDETGHWKR